MNEVIGGAQLATYDAFFNGQPAIAQGGKATAYPGAGFEFCTGDLNGTQLLADLVYTATTQVLTPASACPTGRRPILRGFSLSMIGTTAQNAWAGGTAVEIQDTLGNVLGAFPLVSLWAGCGYTFPSGMNSYRLPATVTGAASTTSVVNFSGTPFVTSGTNSMVGQYATCVAATAGTAANIGQTRRISAHTTAQITLAGTALPIAPASGDIWQINVHQGVSTMSATTETTNDTLTADALIGYWSTILGGTGATYLSHRIVTAAGTAALTIQTLATAGDTTSTFSLQNKQSFYGADDFLSNFSGQSQVAGLNTGIQAVVVGTMTQGSNLRLAGHGYWGL